MDSEKTTRDLFGDLTTLPSGRRGRPSHRWSQSNADKVIMGLALGYEREEIAKGLHISLPTLRKYYFSELQAADMQRTRFELWRATVLAAEANKGNVGAIKELGKIAEKRDRLAAERALRDQAPEEDSDPIGKKEAARRAAAKLASDDPDLTPGVYQRH